MGKKSLSTFFKKVTKTASKHSPEILTGFGIAGMVTTVFLAVRATPKAMLLVEEATERKYTDLVDTLLEHGCEEAPESVSLTKKEYLKAAWKPYVPAIVTGITSTVCLIGACSVGARRTAAFATAYKISETAFTEFKEKAVEVVGEKNVKEIKETVAKEHVEKNPVSKSEVIIMNDGKSLFLDTISMRYFMSDIDTVKKAVNDLNYQMLNEMYISLTDFYYAIGLKPTRVSDDLGWNIDGGKIEVSYGSQIADDGRPCIVIDYNVAPRYDFSDLR